MVDEKPAAVEAPVKKTVKKSRRVVPQAKCYVLAGFNNTLITITDPNGQVLARNSSGASGFKGTKKSTPYAAQVAAERLAEVVQPFGIESLEVFVRGVGPGREQSVRGLAKTFDLRLVVDQTPIPHNGCRKKKRRRV